MTNELRRYGVNLKSLDIYISYHLELDDSVQLGKIKKYLRAKGVLNNKGEINTKKLESLVDELNGADYHLHKHTRKPAESLLICGGVASTRPSEKYEP